MSKDQFRKWDCGSRVINILCPCRYQRRDLNPNMSDSKAQGGPRQTGGGLTPRYHSGVSSLGHREAGTPAHRSTPGAPAHGLRPSPSPSWNLRTHGLIHSQKHPVKEGDADGLPHFTDGETRSSRRHRAEAGMGVWGLRPEWGIIGAKSD